MMNPSPLLSQALAAMTPQRSIECSPFFARLVRSPSQSISRSTSSNHFIQSPNSSFGLLKHYSLLDAIAPPGHVDREQTLIDQFGACPQFKNTYDQVCPPLVSRDARILSSVRHLCSYACYLRAFAPVREWHYLRKAVLEYSDKPVDVVLQGWYCKLLPRNPDESRKPSSRVCFCSPDGKIYTSKVAVLRKLGLVGKDFAIKSRVGVDLENVNCNRKRKTPSSVNIEEMVMKRKTTSRPFAQTNCLIKDVTSPFGLLEELFSDNPWNLLLSTILLNRTSRVQVDVVLNEFLAKWPSPESVAAADWEEISLVIRPLGIRHRRAKGLIRFSRDYLTKIKACSAATMTREDILSLHHCGDYAYDAYRIFIQRNVSTLCADHALQDYVEYQRGALLERTRNVVKRSTNPIPSRSRKSL